MSGWLQNVIVSLVVVAAGWVVWRNVTGKPVSWFRRKKPAQGGCADCHSSGRDPH